jgi:ankyrin repeat protein
MASVKDSWFLSAKQGRDDDLKELVGKIGDVNVKDQLGNTALHYASSGNHAACVKVLLGAKANINAQNNLGETPAHQVQFASSSPLIISLNRFFINVT